MRTSPDPSTVTDRACGVAGADDVTDAGGVARVALVAVVGEEVAAAEVGDVDAVGAGSLEQPAASRASATVVAATRRPITPARYPVAARIDACSAERRHRT